MKRFWNLLIFFIASSSLDASAIERLLTTECSFVLKSEVQNHVNIQNFVFFDEVKYDGICEMHIFEGEHQSWYELGADESATLILYQDGWSKNKVGHFFYLQKNSQNRREESGAGKFEVFWNGGGNSTYARSSLNHSDFVSSTEGSLICWENSLSKICFNESVIRTGVNN